MTIDDLRNPADIYEALSAAHEAGHAVIHELLRVPYTLVTLADDEGPARIESPDDDGLPDDGGENATLCALAGTIAEVLIFARRPSFEAVLGGIGDVAMVQQLLGPRRHDKELVERLQTRTLDLVYANIRQIKRVAKSLLSLRRLTPNQVRTSFAGLPLVMLA